METRQTVIDDLRRLGVKVNQILLFNPSLEQLKENLSSLAVELDDEILGEIETVHQQYPNPAP